MTFAVVPAAGSSVRMGRPKLTLPLGPTTVLQRVVTTLRDGGVDHVLVVVGRHVPDLVSIAEAAGASTLLLPVPTADMRQSVLAGLRRVEVKHRPAPGDRWFLAPGDCCSFRASTVGKLLAVESGSAIVVPVTAGRRGHPVLFSWSHIGGIADLPPDAGIDSFVRGQPVREIPVDDPGILVDLDTPDDYDRMRK